MIKAFKVCKFLKNIKFGMEVLQSTRHAFGMDKQKGISLWEDATEMVISQLHAHESFKSLKVDEHTPPGFNRRPYHCIYDVKFNGRKKCRLVAGKHMTDPASKDV